MCESRAGFTGTVTGVHGCPLVSTSLISVLLLLSPSHKQDLFFLLRAHQSPEGLNLFLLC